MARAGNGTRIARRYKTKEDPLPCDGCAFRALCEEQLVKCVRFNHWAETGKNDYWKRRPFESATPEQLDLKLELIAISRS